MVKFFIVAFIFYPWSGEYPSIKIRQDFKFDTFQECNTLLNNYKPQLMDSLKRKWTGADSYSIRCLDSETLYKLQEDMGYEQERNT